jgi:hypothetical protein
VDPVPDPLLVRKSGSSGNRTRTSGSVASNSDHETTDELHEMTHVWKCVPLHVPSPKLKNGFRLNFYSGVEYLVVHEVQTTMFIKITMFCNVKECNFLKKKKNSMA